MIRLAVDEKEKPYGSAEDKVFGTPLSGGAHDGTPRAVILLVQRDRELLFQQGESPDRVPYLNCLCEISIEDLVAAKRLRRHRECITTNGHNSFFAQSQLSRVVMARIAMHIA